MMLFAVALLFSQSAPLASSLPSEEPVAPYAMGPQNLGAIPFHGHAMADAFGGQAGVRKLVQRMLDLADQDRQIGEIFKGHDHVRLRRALFEQFCTILNAGCVYSGRTMLAAHKDLGVQRRDMNRLVEILQQAMAEQHIGFAAQNRFLAKLAPMEGDITQRSR